MEPIWGSFDVNGSPLMVPLEREFYTTSIDSQQQTQPGSDMPFNLSSPYTSNVWNFYLSSSPSCEAFASAGNLNTDSILDIHGERLANPPTSNQAMYNSSSTVPLQDSEMDQACGKVCLQPIGRDLNDSEALNISWESPAQDLTASSSYVGINTSSLAEPSVIHDEQFGGLAQISTMSQHEYFDEPLSNQQTWAYRSENSNTYDPSIHNDYFLPNGAASATSSLSEYSDASSYCSRDSSQSLSRQAVFLDDLVAPSSFKSRLLGAHKCTVCDKHFTRLSSLQVHSFSHTGEKPFKCEAEGCGKLFSVSSNLRRHQKVHRSEHQGSYESGQQSASSVATSSASSSVNSFQSNRGRNSLQSFFRRSNTSLGDIQGNIWTSLYTSEVSPSPGRRGPLGEAGKAALRAVKAVGACWRCKVLRKKCDPENPCKGCPRKNGSFWQDIGCRRGAILSEKEHLKLCPKTVPSSLLSTPHFSNLTILEIDYAFHGPEAANDFLRKGSKDRERHIKRLERLIEIQSSVLPESLAWGYLKKCLGKTWNPWDLGALQLIIETIPSWSPGIPLRACILAIMWDFAQLTQLPFVEAHLLPKEFPSLLSSAARYQTTSQGDELIAQSLICLRTCLETRRIQNAGYLTKFHHEACKPSLCLVECSANLTLCLKSYLDEFSRVIFRKENLQGDRAWWLSAFYSLCIQDHVRKLLISIVQCLSYECGEADTLAPKCYLHLAIKLFLASSGGYDPIMDNYNSMESIQTITVDHFKLAQDAVDRSSWVGRNIRSSRDYLYRLFEIDDTFNDEELEPIESAANFADYTALRSNIPRGLSCLSDQENFRRRVRSGGRPY